MQNPHDPMAKKAFLDSINKLSGNATQTNILRAVELYSDYLQIPWTDDVKFRKSLEGFARCIASSNKSEGITGEGLYFFTYNSTQEEFSFQDSFPVLYIFDPEHFTNKSGDWISGINLTRMSFGAKKKYLDSILKQKSIGAKQELTYKFITELGKSGNQPFRKFKSDFISNVRKFNDIKNVLPFDVTWTSQLENPKV